MSLRRLSAIFLLLLTLLLAGCGSDTSATPVAEAPVAAPSVATEGSAAPTAPPVATEIPIPTEASVATEIPAPTEAPVATEIPIPTEAALPEMPSLAPADAIRTAMRAQVSGGPYHVEGTDISDAGTVHMTADVIPPDQIHGSVELDGTTSQLIITGGQLWSNQGEGWSDPVAGDMVLTVLQQYLNDPDSGVMTITNEQFVGVDTVNGAPTWLYRFTQQFPEMDSTHEVQLWVEITTGLPLKLESVGEVFGIHSTTTQLITYDDSITISPPQ